MKFYTNVEQAGNRLLVRGYEGGSPFSYRVPYNPTLYVASKNYSDWKTLEGDCVEPLKLGSINDAKEFIKKYREVDDFDIYGNTRYLYQYIVDEHPEDEIRYDTSKIRIFNIDIETAAENGFPDIESADQEILAISIKDSYTGRIVVFGARPFDNKDSEVDYMHFRTEESMLNAFLGYWNENYPDVITGWNVQLFDIPYIARRITRILGEKSAKSLSPWKLISSREIYIKGRKQIAYDLPGISTLDYLELYRKFTYTNQESYRLDHICMVELGERKLDHSEYDTFREFYEKNWQKFIEYNIHDVRLVDKLDDKMKLLDLAFTMAYDAKVNYEDVFSQVRMWDNYIYCELNKRKIAIPPKRDALKDEKYAGAYVKEPKTGRYDWVVNFDLNSLYPHLIMQYNISPETLLDTRHPSVSVDKILEEDLTFEMYKDNAVCANGAMYRKDVRGFLPELMEKMYNERVIFKKRMITAKKKYEKTPTKNLEKEIARCNNIQMAKKISLNSAYGAIGNQYFRYYKLANAEAITLSGQVSIRWIENRMNKYLNKILKTENEDYVIASDTDSIYLNLGPLVETVYKGRETTNESIVSFLNKICEMELEKYITSSYETLANYVNAYDQKMFMKRENIADRGIWTAKKRYILNVWDSEGVRYDEPKLKMMGIEAVKSSTPAPCRLLIKNALKLMMNGTEEDVIDFIDESRKQFKKLPPEEIAFPRTASNVQKYKAHSTIYEKGTPIHIRGALLFNHYVKKNKLDNKYSLISNGEKVKFLYLQKPNIIQENVISFIQDFPRELGLEKYVDYDLQFDKSFVEPLKTILDAIGWNVEKTVNLELFFS